MLKRLLFLVAGCTLLVVPVAYSAAQAAATLPVEYELVNDFAARLQTHLQQTAKILEQLRQTTDPGERQKLMNAYLAAVRTTARYAFISFNCSTAGRAWPVSARWEAE